MDPASFSLFGLTFDQVIVIVVLIAIFAAFAREVMAPDAVALMGAGALMATGVVTTDDVVQVFSNPGPITVGAMFILSAALQQTGMIEQLGRGVTGLARRGPAMAFVGLMAVVMLVSGIVNNTPVVMVLTPVVIGMAHALNVAPSRMLIPLSYAGIFGGTCTLIGTSTNLLVAGVARDLGLEEFSIFEITLPGLVLGGVGILYMLLIGRKLLPERQAFGNVLEDKLDRRFLTELVVARESELIGRKLRDTALLDDGNDTIELTAVMRGGRTWRNDMHDLELRAGDRLMVKSTAGAVMDLRDDLEPNDVLSEDQTDNGDDDTSDLAALARRAGFQPFEPQEAKIMEGIVGPDSELIDQPIGRLNYRQTYNVSILAVHRHGGELRGNFEKETLRMGDTLLLEGPTDGLKRLFQRREVINLSEPETRRFRKSRAPIAVVAISGVVLLAALDVMPIAGLALMGAALVMGSGCLRPREAYQSVDWSILFLIFGMLAIGRGIQASGVDRLVVDMLAEPALALGPIAVLAAIYLACSLMTELITNNAAAILLTPIAAALAQQMGVDPRAFVVAVMFAASASFATPLGYQTNTIVYGAGNYRFIDFVKVGLPLNILMWITAVIVIPIFFPL